MKYEELITKYNEGASNQELALIFNSTPKSISVLLSRLRKGGLVGYHVVKWSDEDNKTLISLRNQGLSNREIATLMNRSENSIKHKASEFIKAGKLPKKDGDYWQVGLDSIKRPGGCHDKGKPTILYLVEFDGFYKIGITQKSIKERFYGAPEYRVVDYLSTDLEFAFEMEASIKKFIEPFIPENKWFERNGKTECFKSAIKLEYLEQLL